MAGSEHKTLTVTQIRSPIGRPSIQRRTLIALRLNKIGRSRELPDTPENRGRIRAVHHLVRCEPPLDGTVTHPATAERAATATDDASKRR